MTDEPAGWQAGTDVGGSFTDVWLRTDDGREIVRKAPTTADVVTGLLEGLNAVAEAAGLRVDELLPRLGRFGHGTTVGLNALLTGRAARTALVTTAGFGDVLEIGRLRRGFAGLRRDQLADYHQRGRTAPLVPRTRVVEVPERMDRTGTVLAPLDTAAARLTLRGLADQGVEAVAVCLLWSTENPVHERALRDLIADETLRAMQLPEASGAALHRDLTVTASCCPVTGALLGVDVHLVGTQPAHDLDLDLSPDGIADQLATKTAPAMHAHVNFIEEP